MNLINIPNINDLQKCSLDIMFAAVPKNFVYNPNKKFVKNKRKKLFYIVYGVLLKETNQYLVFGHIFEISKKITLKNSFKETVCDTAVYDKQQDVLDYIYDFIENFSPHERLVNEEIIQLGPMRGDKAFEYLIEWNLSAIQYFQDLLKK